MTGSAHANVPFDTLRAAVEASWTEDTTFCPETWEPSNPAWGQCAVTSLVLHDYLGGRIRHGEAEYAAVGPRALTTRHYWLEGPWGNVDLTWRQFPKPARLVADDGVCCRVYVLRNRWFQQRYENLSLSVAALLAADGLRAAPPTPPSWPDSSAAA